MQTRTMHRMLIAAVAGAAVMVISATRVLAPVDAFATDALRQVVPQRSPERVAVVAIDDASLQQAGSWPWPRTRLASLISRVASARPTAVGIDLLLDQNRAGDDGLSAVCRPLRCVAAATLDDRGEWILPAPSLRPALFPAHAAFELDDDGILRTISATKQDARLSLPAFALAVAARVQRFPVPSGRALIPGFRVPPNAVPVVPAADVLRGDRAALQRLQGRAVVIGLTALALGDRVMTPRSRRTLAPGVQVHAAAVESLLSGDTLHETSPFVLGIVAAALAWLTAWIGRSVRMSRRFFGECVLLAIPSLLAAALMFAGVIASPVAISAAVAVVAVGVEARHAVAMMQHGRTAAGVLQREIGGEVDSRTDVGSRLEALASAIVHRRIADTESKRIVAHELKTPLASMRSLSQLLAGFELSATERRRVATLLGDEAEKLRTMITGLLELESLSLRRNPDDARTIDVTELMSGRIELLSRSTSRSIEITADETPVIVAGDAGLLERVIDNLVANAIKYSPDPECVSVALRKEGEECVIDVMDRGPGVPLNERERIFIRFSRGVTASGTQGLGLGLALVQEAVRWHGGTVSVHDRNGGGSIFRVRIPLATAHAVAEAV